MESKQNDPKDNDIKTHNTNIDIILENNILETNTLDSNIQTNTVSNISYKYDELEKIKDIIFDFENDQNVRLNAFMICHQQPNQYIYEVTTKLSTMYLFSASSMIKQFLITIAL